MQELKALQFAGALEGPGVDGAQAAGGGQVGDGLAAASSPAMNTSRGAPPTCPATSVPAKVVLNALTMRAVGAAAAICSAADVPGATTSESKVEESTGLEMSMSVLQDSAAAYRAAACLAAC